MDENKICAEELVHAERYGRSISTAQDWPDLEGEIPLIVVNCVRRWQALPLAGRIPLRPFILTAVKNQAIKVQERRHVRQRYQPMLEESAIDTIGQAVAAERETMHLSDHAKEYLGLVEPKNGGIPTPMAVAMALDMDLDTAYQAFDELHEWAKQVSGYLDMAKVRVQAGVESFRGGIRQIRLTPFDHSFEVDDTLAAVLVLIVSQLDQRDAQPGDGEFDVPLRIRFSWWFLMRWKRIESALWSAIVFVSGAYFFTDPLLSIFIAVFCAGAAYNLAKDADRAGFLDQWFRNRVGAKKFADMQDEFQRAVKWAINEDIEGRWPR